MFDVDFCSSSAGLIVVGVGRFSFSSTVFLCPRSAGCLVGKVDSLPILIGRCSAFKKA